MLQNISSFFLVKLILVQFCLDGNDSNLRPSVFTKKLPPLEVVTSLPDLPKVYRGTEFWEEDQERPIVKQFFDGYKSAVNRELDCLRSVLEQEGFDLDDITGDCELGSPREKIKFMAVRVKQSIAVEKIINENESKRLQSERWPGEARPLIGVCITSARDCYQLAKKFSTNGFAQTITGVFALTGAYLLSKRKS